MGRPGAGGGEGEAWEGLGRSGELWGSLGRLGEAWGGLGKPGEVFLCERGGSDLHWTAEICDSCMKIEALGSLGKPREAFLCEGWLGLAWDG